MNLRLICPVQIRSTVMAVVRAGSLCVQATFRDHAGDLALPMSLIFEKLQCDLCI